MQFSQGAASYAPALQFVVGQGVEEGIIHVPFQKAELPARAGIKGHQLGDGLAVAGQHDALAGLDPGQQRRELGFGLLNVDAALIHILVWST